MGNYLLVQVATAVKLAAGGENHLANLLERLVLSATHGSAGLFVIKKRIEIALSVFAVLLVALIHLGCDAFPRFDHFTNAASELGLALRLDLFSGAWRALGLRPVTEFPRLAHLVFYSLGTACSPAGRRLPNATARRRQWANSNVYAERLHRSPRNHGSHWSRRHDSSDCRAAVNGSVVLYPSANAR